MLGAHLFLAPALDRCLLRLWPSGHKSSGHEALTFVDGAIQVPQGGAQGEEALCRGRGKADMYETWMGARQK